MKKSIKIVVIILCIMLGCIILDTCQAYILKNSPIISHKENLGGDNYVARGILVDTYYCSEDEKQVTVNVLFKNSKFVCPVNEQDNNHQLDDEQNKYEKLDKDTILNKINSIVENGPTSSSNPYDYISKSSSIYNELVQTPKETFMYAIEDLIETDANSRNGLVSYIEAILCSNINTNFKYDFISAQDYLEKYKAFLLDGSYTYNEYDNYAKSLLTNIS